MPASESGGMMGHIDEGYDGPQPAETMEKIEKVARYIGEAVCGLPVEVAGNALLSVAAHACVQSDNSDEHIITVFRQHLGNARARKVANAH